MNRLSPPAKLRWNRPQRPGSRFFRADRWAGRMLTDSNNEKSRQGMTMSGMTRKILPIMPGIYISGKKATTVVNTANTTGVAISWAPSIEPRNRSPCRSWWLWMFSPTMIASSTMIPSTRIKATATCR